MLEEPYRHKGNRLARVPRRQEQTGQRHSSIREQFFSEDGKFGFKRTQVVDDVFEAVHSIGTYGKGRADGMRYAGSVPIIVAEIWAKQIGAPIGSKEHTEYTMRQLQSGDWSKLKVYFR